MIVSNLNNCERLASLHPLFPQLFEYVRTHDLLHTPLGRIGLNGDRLFINNAESACVAAEEQLLEVHRKYIDVHFLLEGEETIGWKDLADVTNLTKPYDPTTDCALYADRPAGYVTLRPRQLLVAWPEDPHAPLIGVGAVRKAIAKVRVL